MTVVAACPGNKPVRLPTMRPSPQAFQAPAAARSASPDVRAAFGRVSGSSPAPVAASPPMSGAPTATGGQSRYLGASLTVRR
jgi:hypothetical protein